MKNSDHQTYYSKDYRSSMLLLSLMQFVGLVVIVGGSIVSVSHFKEGIIISLAGIGLSLLFSHLTVKYSAKWIKFSKDHQACEVIYGEIEDIETVSKLKFVPDDMGGIYKDQDQIVIGSIKGEKRCHVEEFSYELINHNSLVNFIKLTINNEIIAFVPKWTGTVSERPSSADKAMWGYKRLQKLTATPDLTPNPYR